MRIALATSKDFVHWNKHGIVGPDIFSKAACLFPEKINGKYTMLFTFEDFIVRLLLAVGLLASDKNVCTTHCSEEDVRNYHDLLIDSQ